MAFSPKLLQQGASGATGGYQISRSLRFNIADSAYLIRTATSAGNRRKWTFSAWIKRAYTGDQKIFSAGTGTTNTTYFQMFLGVNDNLRISNYDSDIINTTVLYRDYSAWYHIVLAADTDNATSTNRLQLYVNGSLVQTGNVTGDTAVNSIDAFNIGRNGLSGGSGYFAGYMTEINLIDGQALTPSSFGNTDAQTGVWGPKAYSGSYGTNGFYLNFSDNSNTTAATLGKDYSGNGNNFTPNNFSVTAGVGNDSLVDVPTNFGVDTGAGGTVRGNYATINPYQLISNVSVSNGNLYLQSNNNQDQYASAPSTVAVRTGKWYAEFTASAVAGTPSYVFGVGRASWSPIILDGQGYYGRWWYTSEGYAYISSNGGFYNNNSYSSTGATFASGDIIGIALNLDAGSIAFYKNGVLQGTPFTSITLGVDYVFVGGAFTTPYPTPTNISAFFANFGQRPFAYTAPSGFKALCTQNLPTPTIGATTATQAGKFFNTVLYTGTGSNLAITGVGFQPDWLWIKHRSGTDPHTVLDVLRGVDIGLTTNTSAAEVDFAIPVQLSFDSDGFTLGTNGRVNESAQTFVAWNWKANGSGSTNTAGSITSTVSASTTSGFSVVTWTGNGADASIGHGLGVVPSMVIHKFRGAVSNWSVYTSTTGAGKRLKLNSLDAVATDGSFPTTPTSSVFYINGGSNDNGVTMVAYCFAEVAGYSKFGSYTGNGSTDGTFIYTGFRPAFVMVKNTANPYTDWYIIDAVRNTYNATGLVLRPNTTTAEQNYTPLLDFLSNGFKIRDTGAPWNNNGDAIIYMSFASNPFKFSLAR